MPGLDRWLRESAVASSCSVHLDPPVAHAKGTNTGGCSAIDASLQQIVLRIDDLTLQVTMILHQFPRAPAQELYRVQKKCRPHHIRDR